jgi:A/G-specific adenine glycosylase
VAYALIQRRGKVALVQRGANESLMAGMWELPAAHVNGDAPLMTVKHSITNTDYSVRVFAAPDASAAVKWFSAAEAVAIPLTGLARKILRRAGIIQ